MRAQRERSGSLFSYASLEKRIPTIYQLRRLRILVDQTFGRLNCVFSPDYLAARNLAAQHISAVRFM
jgi:hypothetical protein